MNCIEGSGRDLPGTLSGSLGDSSMAMSRCCSLLLGVGRGLIGVLPRSYREVPVSSRDYESNIALIDFSSIRLPVTGYSFRNGRRSDSLA